MSQFYSNNINISKTKNRYTVSFKYNDSSFEGCIIESKTCFSWIYQRSKGLDDKTTKEIVYHAQLAVKKLVKPQYKLMSSASTLEALKDLIKSRMYWSSVDLNLETGVVSSSNGPIEGLRVILKAKRYRLERLIP